LGLLTCKTVSQITYTVLVETLNPAQSINMQRSSRIWDNRTWKWWDPIVEGKMFIKK